MSSGISFSGLSSGIDSAQIINQLIAIERRPVTLLENQQILEREKLAVLQAINTSLLAVKTNVESLSDPDAFDVFTASSSDTDKVDITATADATPGTFSVEVLIGGKLGKAQDECKPRAISLAVARSLGLEV